MVKINIGIIGSGKMGGNLARLWANKGYTIYLTSNNLESTKKLADSINKDIFVMDTGGVVKNSDVILFGFPYEALESIAQYKDLFEGKIIMDCINPLTSDALAMLIGHNTSAGEEVAKLFPKASVVKAFNVVASPVLEKDDVCINNESPSVFFCGDDMQAVKKVEELISVIGFEPVYSGELKNSRYLEPMAVLLIQLAVGGLGANIAFKLLK